MNEKRLTILQYKAKARKKKVLLSNELDKALLFTVWTNLDCKSFEEILTKKVSNALHYLYQCDSKPKHISNVTEYLLQRKTNSNKYLYQIKIDTYL